MYTRTQAYLIKATGNTSCSSKTYGCINEVV